MTCKLSLATLDEAKKTAAVPSYSRDDLSAGIVHFGVGNFHRAHQAVYLDDLFNTGADHDFAIIGAGVLPSDTVMREKLAAQDFLTTVVEQDNNRTGAVIVLLYNGRQEILCGEFFAHHRIRRQDTRADDREVMVRSGVEEVVEINRLMGAVEIANAEMHDAGRKIVPAVGRNGCGLFCFVKRCEGKFACHVMILEGKTVVLPIALSRAFGLSANGRHRMASRCVFRASPA